MYQIGDETLMKCWDAGRVTFGALENPGKNRSGVFFSEAELCHLRIFLETFSISTGG